MTYRTSVNFTPYGDVVWTPEDGWVDGTEATPHVDGDTVVCAHCKRRVAFEYDGPGSGWSHLYPGPYEGTVRCMYLPD